MTQEQAHFFEKRSYGVQFIYMLFFLPTGLLIFSLLAQGCAMLIWGNTSKLAGEPQIHYYWLTQLIGSLGTWLAPALLFSFLATGTVYTYSNADKTPKLKAVCLVILMAVALLPVVGVLAYWNEQVHLPAALSQVEEIMRQMEESSDKVLELMISAQGTGALLANILILGALPALCEEFFFRGAMQPLFEKWTGNKHTAVIIIFLGRRILDKFHSALGSRGALRVAYYSRSVQIDFVADSSAFVNRDFKSPVVGTGLDHSRRGKEGIDYGEQ